MNPAAVFENRDIMTEILQYLSRRDVCAVANAYPRGLLRGVVADLLRCHVELSDPSTVVANGYVDYVYPSSAFNNLVLNRPDFKVPCFIIKYSSLNLPVVAYDTVFQNCNIDTLDICHVTVRLVNCTVRHLVCSHRLPRGIPDGLQTVIFKNAPHKFSQVFTRVKTLMVENLKDISDLAWLSRAFPNLTTFHLFYTGEPVAEVIDIGALFPLLSKFTNGYRQKFVARVPAGSVVFAHRQADVIGSQIIDIEDMSGEKSYETFLFDDMGIKHNNITWGFGEFNV